MYGTGGSILYWKKFILNDNFSFDISLNLFSDSNSFFSFSSFDANFALFNY